MSDNHTDTSKKLTKSIILAVILAVFLCITTYALVYAVSVENNIFRTGKVDINLNDGKALINEHEFLFEPGMIVKKDFFIENKSTWSVYYRLYLDNVSGGLADMLEITFTDGDTVICSGTAADLNRSNVKAADQMLQVGEKKTLSAYFHFPEDKDSKAQNLTLVFDLCADAVQTRNNPGKVFD